MSFFLHFTAEEKTQRLQCLTLCVVDRGGGVLGGHKQHAELW